MMNLTPYINRTTGERAFFKNIPIGALKDAKAAVRARFNGRLVIRYRGTRTHPCDSRSQRARHQDCLKQFASRFSIYIR